MRPTAPDLSYRLADLERKVEHEKQQRLNGQDQSADYVSNGHPAVSSAASGFTIWYAPIHTQRDIRVVQARVILATSLGAPHIVYAGLYRATLRSPARIGDPGAETDDDQVPMTLISEARPVYLTGADTAAQGVRLRFKQEVLVRAEDSVVLGLAPISQAGGTVTENYVASFTQSGLYEAVPAGGMTAMPKKAAPGLRYNSVWFALLSRRGAMIHGD